MTTQVTVSKHALERLKERLGLNRKAAKRQAVLAWERGVQPQHYAIKEWRELYSRHQEQDDSVMLLIYNDMLYVWGLKDGCPNLVTVHGLESRRVEREIYLGGEMRRVE